MDFTREPIIETVITPKDGFKLAVRSSKNANHEEYFVDAVEVVTFGGSSFFRSLERPKSFLVPVSDYEVLEVREARLVLKNVGIDRSIKIGGGREGAMRPSREHSHSHEKSEPAQSTDTKSDSEQESEEGSNELRSDRKRDRRRQQRRRRERMEVEKESGEVVEQETSSQASDAPVTPEGAPVLQEPKISRTELTPTTASILSTLLPPPSTLISETIARYRENDLFKGAFFLRDEPQPDAETDDVAEDLEYVQEFDETPPQILSEQLSQLEQEHEQELQETSPIQEEPSSELKEHSHAPQTTHHSDEENTPAL